MKLAIVGSRTFTNQEKGLSVFDLFFGNKATEIVSGGANGADFIAQVIATVRSLPITVFLPDWKAHGKAAGMIRNKDIISHSDMVLAFWDGKSKGTKNSIDTARSLLKPTFIWYFVEEPTNPWL